MNPEHEDLGPETGEEKVDISGWMKQIDAVPEAASEADAAAAETRATVESVDVPPVDSETLHQALETSRDAGQSLIDRAKGYPETLNQAVAMPDRLKGLLDQMVRSYTGGETTPATKEFTEKAAAARADTLSTLIKGLVAVDSPAPVEPFNVDGSSPQVKDNVDSAVQFIKTMTGTTESPGVNWADLADKAKKGETALVTVPLGLDLSFTVDAAVAEGGEVHYRLTPADTRPGRLEQAPA